jgi:release factor glutamine methyltransferase
VIADDDVVARLRAAGCVFAEDEAALLRADAADGARLDAMVARRVAGEPLEQVLGWAEFCGLRIVVEPGVFVPRRRTGFLARQAIARTRPGAVVVDLCCGSGALGAAIAAAVPGVVLHAADVDPAAVHCARRNLPGAAGVHQGDLYAALPPGLRGRVDVVVANVPYVPTEAVALMPPEARDHEPRSALDGGGDGLAVARRVVDGAPDWLVPGGSLLIETSEEQAPSAASAFAAAALVPEVVADDDLGATVVIGVRSRRQD